MKKVGRVNELASVEQGVGRDLQSQVTQTETVLGVGGAVEYLYSFIVHPRQFLFVTITNRLVRRTVVGAVEEASQEAGLSFPRFGLPRIAGHERCPFGLFIL